MAPIYGELKNGKRYVLTPASEIKPRAAKPIPKAPAIDVWKNRSYPGCYIIEVQCPHCPKTHTHGWLGSGDDGGHRVSHCGQDDKPNPGYYIEIPESWHSKYPGKLTS